MQNLIAVKTWAHEEECWNANSSFISAVTKAAHLERRKVADATKVWHSSKPQQRKLYPLNNNSSLLEVYVFIQMKNRANIKCPIFALWNHHSNREIVKVQIGIKNRKTVKHILNIFKYIAIFWQKSQLSAL